MLRTTQPFDSVSPRARALLALVPVTAFGFLLSGWRGPGSWLLNNWGASLAYEVFFLLLVFVLIPRREAIGRIALGVCLATVALEFLQLWHPGWLQEIRATYLGRGLLGNHFSWLDLPAYPAGCWFGWLLLRRISR